MLKNKTFFLPCYDELCFTQVNAYLVLILQFLVTVFASFAFGYLAPFYLYGQSEVGPRLLIGVLCGFLAGIADLYFVIRQMLDDDGIRLAKKIS
jgi:Endoplasmic reticulum-based factor for assembly of V-ATPase